MWLGAVLAHRESVCGEAVGLLPGLAPSSFPGTSGPPTPPPGYATVAKGTVGMNRTENLVCGEALHVSRGEGRVRMGPLGGPHDPKTQVLGHSASDVQG